VARLTCTRGAPTPAAAKSFALRVCRLPSLRLPVLFLGDRVPAREEETLTPGKPPSVCFVHPRHFCRLRVVEGHWYSNKARGMRRKAAEAAEGAAATLEPPAASSSGDAGLVSARSRSSQTWATCLLTGRCSPAGRQVKRLYEIDPQACSECGGQMKVVALLEPRAPERSDGRVT
jgi:hypothetical protein